MNDIIASETADMQEDTQYGRYLTFEISNEHYGIEIKYVIEIIGIQPITALPEVPAYIKGIINLRGEIIPVMDVRRRFFKKELSYNDRTCIIISCFDGLNIGLIVDCVSEVLTIPDSGTVPPPEINKTSNRFIKSIGKVDNKIILLLDYEKLLDGKDVKRLTPKK